MTPVDWSSMLRVLVETPTASSYEAMFQKHLFIGGTLLTKEDQFQLSQLYGNDNQKWNLIYKATRDGFTIDDFHRCCDNQGPTMTVIQSLSEYLFGGYTSISWNFQHDLKSSTTDRTAYLFTLANPHGILPTKYAIKSTGMHAIVPNAMEPTFGQYDICIYPNSNLNSQSYIKFPSYYNDSTGKGYLTFTGSTNFTTTDIEIYCLASAWNWLCYSWHRMWLKDEHFRRKASKKRLKACLMKVNIYWQKGFEYIVFPRRSRDTLDVVAD